MILLLQHKTPIGDQVWRMCGGASNNKQDSVVVRRADPLPERRSTRVNYRRATIITRPGLAFLASSFSLASAASWRPSAE